VLVMLPSASAFSASASITVGKADAKFTNLFLKYGANVNVR
jgi:hypothetical protein